MTEQKKTRLIMVDLSDEEIAERKNKLVKAESELQKVTADKAEAMASYNATLKDRRNEIRSCVAAIQTGSEEREVEVYERHDKRRNTVETVRGDTKEVIHERAMTAEERQGGLFDDGATEGEEPTEDKPKRGRRAKKGAS